MIILLQAIFKPLAVFVFQAASVAVFPPAFSAVHLTNYVYKKSNWTERLHRSVHTTPEKFQKTALFLRLALPPTLIRHKNRAFRKRSSNRRNLKTPTALRNHVISLTEFSPNTNPKWPVIVAFLDFSGVVWTKNVWCVFRVKPPLPNSSAVVWT